jgi:hypothetical protein
MKILLNVGYVDEYGSGQFWFILMIKVSNMYFNVYRAINVMWL